MSESWWVCCRWALVWPRGWRYWRNTRVWRPSLLIAWWRGASNMSTVTARVLQHLVKTGFVRGFINCRAYASIQPYFVCVSWVDHSRGCSQTTRRRPRTEGRRPPTAGRSRNWVHATDSRVAPPAGHRRFTRRVRSTARASLWSVGWLTMRLFYGRWSVKDYKYSAVAGW